MISRFYTTSSVDMTWSFSSQIPENRVGYPQWSLQLNKKSLKNKSFSNFFDIQLFFSRYQIVLCCAVGFDSYVIIRHGVPTDDKSSSTTDKNTRMLSGNKLGCYFCNDVVAPGDVRIDRFCQRSFQRFVLFFTEFNWSNTRSTMYSDSSRYFDDGECAVRRITRLDSSTSVKVRNNWKCFFYSMKFERFVFFSVLNVPRWFVLISMIRFLKLCRVSDSFRIRFEVFSVVIRPFYQRAKHFHNVSLVHRSLVEFENFVRHEKSFHWF